MSESQVLFPSIPQIVVEEPEPIKFWKTQEPKHLLNAHRKHKQRDNFIERKKQLTHWKRTHNV